MQLQKTSTYIAVSIIFGGIFIAATLASLNIYSQPLSDTTTQNLGYYYQSGRYDYTARLVPNYLYGKTTMKPGEGILFTDITRELSFDFNYSIDGSPQPQNVSLQNDLELKIYAMKNWEKVFSLDEPSNIFNVRQQGPDFSLDLNVTQLVIFSHLIEEETGVYSPSFNFTISPKIQTGFSSGDVQKITSFNPELTLTFIAGRESGNYIQISELEKSDTTLLTITTTTNYPDRDTLRKILPILASASLVVTLAALFTYYKNDEKKENETKKKMEPNADLIIESITEPRENKNINEVGSFEDIIRASEILLKPILHYSSEGEDIFWVNDEAETYRYVINKNDQKKQI